MYWAAMLEGVRDLHGTNFVHAEVNKTRDWASQVSVRHLLSHTSGLLRSGHQTQVEAHYGRTIRDYRSSHLAILKGVISEPEHSSGLKCFLDGSLYVPKEIDGKPNPAYKGTVHQLPPFGFAPGTERCYSNHGFGLLGHIIGEVGGGRMYHAREGYVDLITGRVLSPLGLDGVVANNTRLDQGLDAWPYGKDSQGRDAKLDPSSPAGFVSTGSWSATAQDLARVMCGLDRASNHLRLLRPETVTMMETTAFPSANARQPLGWDRRSNNGTGLELYKNGNIGSGASVVMKFLPGWSPDAPEDEINVAIAVNGGRVPPESMVSTIAEKAAKAAIPSDYDLFDPAHRCLVEGPTLTIHEPGDNTSFPLGTEIHFEAEARDGTGQPLPITWDIPGAGERVTQPSSFDGRHSVFYDGLPEGPNRIVATTEDAGGHQARQELTVVITYDAPKVSILTPKDGATVQPGQPLQLAGQSTLGAFQLPDDQVGWEVERDGTVVHTGAGHHQVVPAHVMQPGAYTMTFSGHDGVSPPVRQSIRVTVEAEPADDPSTPTGPTATITEPSSGSVHVDSGSGAEIEFAGTAVDGGGAAIAGTFFRWTAQQGGEVTVLCEGTDIAGPSGDGGGFAAETSCASFTATLPGMHIAGETLYTVTLEARDADGNAAIAETIIKVFVPPAG
jgi:CubicO group peptidase (beta-lactamase class C family)